jgi:hypothetical protein
MSQGALHRWGPLAGPVFVVLMIAGFVIAGSSPDPDASNAKIAAYIGKDSNFTKNAVAFFVLLAALLFLVTFFAALRARLVEAEGGAGSHGALALGAGIASAVFLILAISIFVSPLFAAHDAKKNLIDPGIYRLTQDLGYMLWVASTVVGALVVWATSAVALRTGVLPRWFAWFGIVVGVLLLLALFFIPIFLYWLWILIAGILLAMRPAPVAGTGAVGAPPPAT